MDAAVRNAHPRRSRPNVNDSLTDRTIARVGAVLASGKRPSSPGGAGRQPRRHHRHPPQAPAWRFRPTSPQAAVSTRGYEPPDPTPQYQLRSNSCSELATSPMTYRFALLDGSLCEPLPAGLRRRKLCQRVECRGILPPVAVQVHDVAVQGIAALEFFPVGGIEEDGWVPPRRRQVSRLPKI